MLSVNISLQAQFARREEACIHLRRTNATLKEEVLQVHTDVAYALDLATCQLEAHIQHLEQMVRARAPRRRVLPTDFPSRSLERLGSTRLTGAHAAHGGSAVLSPACLNGLTVLEARYIPARADVHSAATVWSECDTKLHADDVSRLGPRSVSSHLRAVDQMVWNGLFISCSLTLGQDRPL